MVKPIIKEENEENIEKTVNEDDKVVDEEYEDIFNNMETVGEVKRKRKHSEGEKKKQKKKKKTRNSKIVLES